ncbi:E3 ubiquitin-protein ligase IPI1-like isoform X2 [Aristolochia californica]|uniref:E3 ubiquitin-protein ligase IPI1-like isoform X2 n=1 Tax=Aristolochia californica TaxID=171875 RepID=UPI0035E0BD1A
MDLERSGLAEENRKELCCGDGSSSVSCSICLEFVVYRGERSIAKLQCGHEFHLDCIGSAFNAKGAMQCPNCRKIEKGQWLYANGYRSFADFNVEDWVNEDLYDLGYSDLPFGFQWCPFRGFMQLSSFFEEGEPLPNLWSPNASTSSTHVCPYLTLHGFPHPIHPTPTNAATDGLPDAAASFHRHPIALGGPSADVVNSHGFSSAEVRPHGWQHVPHPFTASASVGGLSNTEQPLSQMPSRLSRNESGGQQRLGSFVHPLHFIHGSAGRAGSSLVASLVPPVVGDGREHTRGPGGHHVFQQSASASSLRSPPFAPVRRPRSRGLALISATGGNASGEASEFYGFSVTGSVSLTHQDGESTGRRSDRVYGWVRDGFAPVPWVPVEGESQWWNPFHSNQNPHQAGSAETMNRSYFPQRVLPERVAQGRPDTAYQRVPLPRMSPFM